MVEQGVLEQQLPAVRELARALTIDAIRALSTEMKSSKGAPRVAAAVAILDRGWGKPTQPIDLEVNRAAQRIASAIGADPEFLIRRAQQLAAENAGAEGTGS